MGRRLALPLLALFSLSATAAFGDMLYLKNGGSIEGVIEREDTGMVTVNMGYGKISIVKNDIESIQRYAPGEQNGLIDSWNYKYFTRPEFVPEGLRDIAAGFDRLIGLRESALKSVIEKKKTEKELKTLEKELGELNENLASVSEQLTIIKPQGALEKYNSLVNEFNSLMAKNKLAEDRRGKLKKEMNAWDKNVSEYMNDLGLFRNEFLKRFSSAGAESNEDKYFLEGVRSKLEKMDGDFTKHPVVFERSGLSIVVDVLLNGLIKVPLTVDTGASVVVIPRGIARKLRLGDMTGKGPPMLLTLADGRKIPANPVILKSIRVGEVEAKNVQAAVLENDDTQEECGLLGMSFLENFVVRMDAKSNRLVFEEFNP